MSSYDAVVVGAGLAGLTFACDLSGRGFRVLLLDRKESLAAPVHTTGIFVRRTLEDAFLPEALLGPAVRDVVLYSPARRPLHLASSRDEFRVGDMGAIYQWLAARCEARSVEWMPSTHFIRSDGERLMLRRNGRDFTVRTRLLVGADGCASRVARDLDLDVNTEWIVGAEEVLGGAKIEGPPRFECILDPRIAPGYLAWVVHDGVEIHLGVGGYPAQFQVGAALKRFRDECASRMDLRGATVLERRGGRIPVGGVLRRISNRRGLLVGDAAGAVSPLTAGGLDGAIRLSRLAARVAARALGTGDTAVLDAYSGELFRARFFSRLWMRRWLRLAGSPAVLEVACAALRTAPGRRLAWQVFFGRGSFPDIELPLPFGQPALD